MIRNTKGLKIYLENLGAPAPTPLTLTAVTAAKPAVASAAATTGLVDGEMVKIAGTGMPSLDGKTFIIGSLATGEFTLVGSDSTNDVAATSGTATHLVNGTDTTLLCLSSIAINADIPGTISTGTFCDPNSSVPGTVATAGTIDLNGYVDTTDAGYALLIAAELDGLPRDMVVEIPGQGHVVVNGVVSSMNISDIPIDGAVAYTAVLTLTTKPVHLF